jgi:tRNA G10  N-methylase Trm11
MTNELLSVEGKTIFGISIYRATDELKLGTLEMLERWGKTIKQTLKQSVQSVRYVESREPILSSVSVDKNGLVKRGREFLVYEEKDGSFSVAKTMAVQPFEELGARDFGRPGRDDTSGMLPPKLALMLINLTGATTNQTLLDPFCGSGTVITEAMVLGFQTIIGSDISEKAVSDTKKNVAWQRAEDVTSAQVKIFQSEAHELAGKLPTASVDAIATEPYLGKPLRGGEARSVLTTQIQGLKKMYVAAFMAFAKILKPGGTVVFVVPCFKYQNTWLRIECLKEIKKCGFTTLPLLADADFVLYARPDQRVGREIWRFKKN